MNFQEFKNKFEVVPVENYPTGVAERCVVSVIVVTFQHAAYIRQCLESVLMQQTSFDFELLLGEDASTDGTREICLEFADKFPEKIKLFLHHRENNIKISGSPTGRFNMLYNLFSARGKYIALCEGDDYWTDPLKLQKQVDFLETNSNYSLCFHEVLMTNNEVAVRPYTQIHKQDILTEDLFDRHFIATCSIVYRNQVDFPPWFTKVASADKLLLLLTSLRGKIRFLEDSMGAYRIHSGGISNTHIGIKKVYDTAVLLSHFDDYCGNRYTKECHEGLFYEIESHLNEFTFKNQKKLFRNMSSLQLLREIIFRFLNRTKSVFSLR